MSRLVVLTQAMARLRISTDEDADLQAILDEAEAIVLGFIAQRRTDDESPTWADQIAAWDPTTVPADVRAGILRQCAELYRYRGDDPASTAPPHQPGRLSDLVEAILWRYRDPTVA